MIERIDRCIGDHFTAFMGTLVIVAAGAFVVIAIHSERAHTACREQCDPTLSKLDHWTCYCSNATGGWARPEVKP